MSTDPTPVAPKLPAGVRTDIEEHVFSSPQREVGGVLLGRLDDEAAIVEAAVPALQAESDVAHLTFTHETWAGILQTVDSQYPDLVIVGWYHSHPGHSVFLSGYDLFIQRNFFTDSRMVALVIDPRSGDAAWFGWSGEEIGEISRERTQTPALGSASGSGSSSGSSPGSPAGSGAHRRGPLVGAVLVTAVIAGIAGYAVATLSATDDAELEQAAALIADQEQRILELEAAAQPDGDGTPDGQAPPEGVTQPDSEEAPDGGTPPGTEPTDGGTPDTSQEAIYTLVRPGDSWWGLAERFYGDGASYPLLQQANPEIGVLDSGVWVAIPQARLSR